jgi:hypothetical protein
LLLLIGERPEEVTDCVKNDIFKFAAGTARNRDNASHRVGCFRNIRLGTIKPTRTGSTARNKGPERSFG